MAIHWRLKTYLAQYHSIYKVKELQEKIRKNTGVIISVQNLSKYLNQQPKAIRLATVQIICSALNCKLDRFCTVTPSEKRAEKERKLAYQNTPISKRGVTSCPDPVDYL